MKKATQRVLSLLLAAVLLFGMLPMSAFAAETEQTGIAAPEVDVTDTPEMAESEPVESIGDDTIPAEATQVETVTMETTVPTTEPEVTHGEEMQPVETVPETTHCEEMTEPAETVSDETVPEETQPEETVPATEPEVTEPMVTQPEITETAPVETSPILDFTTEHPLADLDNVLANTGADITPYASDDGRCLVLGRVWTNVYENGSNQITYEYPAGTVKTRPHVELHVVKINGKWKAAYCMEPGVPTVPTSSGYDNKVFTMQQLLQSGLLSSNLTRKQVEAMGLVALYGQQKIPGQTDMTAYGRMAATQMIMWEIAIGWRSGNEPYTRISDAFARRFLDKKNAGTGCLVNGSAFYGSSQQLGYADAVQTAYNEIAAKVERHYLMPSFCYWDKADAPIIYLEPDGNGNYTATVTDTNNILSEYTLPTMDGVTFTKNGNKLTITTKEKFDAKLVAPTKVVPNMETQSYYYWYNGSYQTLISCAAEPSNDPVPAYFKIQSKEREGKIEVNKNDPNGKKLDGAYFVATNQETGEKYTIGPTVNGYASKDHIPYGSYEIEETVFPEGYTTSGTSEWTKTLNESTPNATITINAVNKLKTAPVTVTKTSPDGNVDGITFTIKNNTTGESSTKETANGGKFSIDVVIGHSITITEHIPEGYLNAESSKTITIKESGNTVSFANTPITGNVELKKVDAVTGKVLSGAVFEATDSKGNTYTMTDMGNGIYRANGLAYGKVTIREAAAPKGYVASDTTYTVAIKENGKTYTVKAEGYEGIPNKPIEGNIEFTKVDAETGSLIAGAKFEATDSTGKVYDIPEVEPGTFRLEGLPYGIVMIRETSAPEGYIKSDSTFSVNITEDGKTYTIANEGYEGVANKPIRGSIAFNKISSETWELIAGAKFEATDSTGKIHNIPEVTPGTFRLENLPYGMVTIREVSAPEGYIKDKTVYTVYITEDGKTYTIATDGYDGVANKPIRGNVAFNKINSETGELLSGAVFELTDSTGTTQIVPEIEPGVYFLDNIPYGKVTVKEVSVPEGYVMIDQLFELNITEDGKTYTIFTEGYDGVANKPIRGSIAFNKINSETDELLSGAVFELTDSTGTTQIVPEIEPGVYFLDNIPYGKVTVKEVSVPEGYVMIDELFELEVTEDGKTYTIFTEDYDGVANKPIRGNVEFTKINSETGDLIAGAKFEATDSTGKVYDIPEVAPGTFRLEGLPYGIVMIRETSAPEGYIKSAAAFSVNITEDGKTYTIANEGYEGVANKPIRGSVAFNKINSETGELLSGAVFELTDSTGTTQIVPEIEPGVYFLDNIPYGKVTVKEVSVPEGYVMIDELFELEVTEDGKTYTIFTEGYEGVANKPIRGSIAFNKINSETWELLSGAVFELTDSTGQTYTVPEIEPGVYFLDNIPYGKVTVKEVSVPEGYVMIDELFELEVTEDGKTYTIFNEGYDGVANKPIRGNVEFTKINSETGDLIAGAKFEATDSTGKVYDIPEVAPGTFRLEGLPYGIITIREVAAPEGYICDDAVYTINVTEDGETYTIKTEGYEGIANTRIYGSITFTKIDAETGELLSGAVFELTDSTGQTHTVPEVEPGVFLLEDLPYGKVTIKEITAPEGYKVNSTVYTVEILENGKTYTVAAKGYSGIPNKAIPDGPETGDASVMGVWMAAAFISGVALVMLHKSKKHLFR